MDRPVVLKWAVGYCIFACIKLPYHILHSRIHFQVNILPYLNFHLPYDLKRGSFLHTGGSKLIRERYPIAVVITLYAFYHTAQCK